MSATPTIAVIGAGGHAKVVIATLQAAGYESISVFDNDPGQWGAELLGFPVVGPMREVGERRFVSGIVAIGCNSKRKEMVSALTLEWISVIHPSATVHTSVVLGVGAVVLAGAVIQPDTVVGEHVIVNTGATLDHDCRIGDFAHIGPRAALLRRRRDRRGQPDRRRRLRYSSSTGRRLDDSWCRGCGGSRSF